MRHTIRFTLALIGLLPALSLAADSDKVIVKTINTHLRQGWVDNEIAASARATDGEFARRVSLDVVGHIPRYARLAEFLDSEKQDRREQLVELLLDDEDYVRNWTTFWGNLLIGRTNNQGNRRPLDRWLRRSLTRNMPYNRFVFELVAAEGTSDENGAVNFLVAHLNNGAVPATAITARLFLGMQVQCTQCHNHPFNDWKQSQFWSMNAFFSGTRRLGNRNAFRLVDLPSREVKFFEKRSGLQEATLRKFVDGTSVTINDQIQPRRQLAELITDASKPYMARTAVNRLWSHFFGFGFTRPIDDMGPHNPASHPELLDYLATQFRLAGYDTKRLIRWITASEAYNLSSRIGEKNADDDPAAGTTPLFSRMYVKQFQAEQLYDSLIIATNAHKVGRGFDAAENQRRTWLRQFVQTFGTDENDESTTFNGTIPQALVMMNGALINSALSTSKGSLLQRVVDSPKGDIRPVSRTTSPRSRRKRKTVVVSPLQAKKNRYRAIPRKIQTLFLVALQRQPTPEEMTALDRVFQEGGGRDPIAGLQDVFWAVLNSNEFITNH
ncbi:MAG: DUF1549 and DUF1553 domain-containing protein [Planctomycetaceae bacterium]|jgi:hypothetical protein|nr:DUF1549 and DUF1553 domain-containing protein [Planctomycetaceae bacterium]